MLISGIWKVDRDGLIRPYFHAEAQKADGSWYELYLLVDSGADRTVLTAHTLQELGYEPPAEVMALSGLGGQSPMVQVPTTLRFYREDHTAITIKGPYAAMVTATALDANVLGRDILNQFPVIIDRPVGRIYLLHPPHRYTIHPA